MKIYFISGLGADERIFKHIHLPAPYIQVQVPWLKPHTDETLPDYAVRMSSRIDKSEKFSVAGLSFGGMIATEIANQMGAEKTILISSIPAYEQLPLYYRVAGKLGLHRIMPTSMIQHASWLKRLFTPETKEDKVMLKNMIRDIDPVFIRWALHAILTWRNQEVPPHLFQIHGTKDRILPIRNTHPTHVVMAGGHLMVLNRAAEINSILAEILK